MPRYVFTQNDLAQFLPLLRKPIVQQAIAVARPIKDFEQAPQLAVDAGTVAVDIRGKDTPNGLKLETLHRLVKGELGFVRGIASRNGRLEVLATREPTPEERVKLTRLLTDKTRLEQLRKADEDAPPQGGPGNPSEPPDQGHTMDPHIREMLLNEKMPDDKWLQVFRRYAVAELVPKK